MGSVQKTIPVKLVVGIISSQIELFPRLEKILKSKFGEIDFRSEIIPFIHTDYYQEEFGIGLQRYFLSFKKLINPEKIAGIKLFTNKIEARFSRNQKRQINIDPGYLSDAKLVLATTKNFAHRIYLDKGIYAEVTLFYRDNKFCFLPWTYPDYKTEEYSKVFQHIRSLYLKELNEK